jgi:hypothetical protein
MSKSEYQFHTFRERMDGMLWSIFRFQQGSPMIAREQEAVINQILTGHS